MRVLALALLVALCGCGMPGQTEDPNQGFWESFYSYGKSEEQHEADWWGGFYGTKKPQQDTACGFYGTCDGK